MGKTKKVKASGKFGPRYGMKARKRFAAIEEGLRRRHECPACKRRSARRISTGIWLCRKCGNRFVGGAYLSRTTVARDSERVLKSLEEGA